MCGRTEQRQKQTRQREKKENAARPAEPPNERPQKREVDTRSRPKSCLFLSLVVFLPSFILPPPASRPSFFLIHIKQKVNPERRAKRDIIVYPCVGERSMKESGYRWIIFNFFTPISKKKFVVNFVLLRKIKEKGKLRRKKRKDDNSCVGLVI